MNFMKGICRRATSSLRIRTYSGAEPTITIMHNFRGDFHLYDHLVSYLLPPVSTIVLICSDAILPAGQLTIHNQSYCYSTSFQVSSDAGGEEKPCCPEKLLDRKLA